MHLAEPLDLVQYGLIPEFIGRVPVISTLETLTEDELIMILTEPKNSVVKQFTRLFATWNVRLIIEPSALKAMASQALKRKTGARGLKAALVKINVFVNEIPCSVSLVNSFCY